MSRRLQLLPVLQGAQKAASNPAVHAALSASAGTGKTQVLTARVLRLLLQGVAPQTILCLTFTKAGAAEMANRIGARLAAWVRMRDSDLEKEMFALGEARDKPALQRARRLFARVLEAPGGLRIQTIHSFAQALLASFPAEAGIAPGFQPIEGRAEAELARRTLANLLSDAEASGNDALLADVQQLSLRLGETGATDYLLNCAAAHDEIAALGDPAGFERQLRELMNVPEGDIEAHLAAACGDDRFDCEVLRRLIAANRTWGSATGTTICGNLETWLAAPADERARSLAGITAKIVIKDGSLAKISEKQRAADPDYEDLAARLADKVRELCAIRTAAELAKTQAAGLRAGAAFASAYARAKRAAGVADFNDLIRWTRALLEQPGMGEWVRFKLDQRTDHILVDEAQDTNSDQWAIVKALISEFFSGEPEAEGRWRTVFTVGDNKQAIYSFQGSDPREFELFRTDIADRASALEQAAFESDMAARAFHDLSIDASFRSSPAILQAVDAVIGELGHEAMGLSRAPNRHAAAHPDRPGRVELWPPFEASGDEDAGEEGWIEEPVRHYADALAKQVRAWVDEAPVLASTGRPLTPGDVLILVRNRTELAALLVARLYARGVPVAGIDRLLLSKPLAVKDLLSAVAFAVQPLDDLNLAGLLVSPLVGWDQQMLFDLAHGRSRALWAELQARREESDAFAAAHALLGELLRMAELVPPSRFLETILSGPIAGRRKLLERLGLSARDPIEELVASALEFERQESPSLDRFLAWFAAGDVQVKRDPSAPSNAVRVMTVHGAKGLEAPLVILADATHDPSKAGGPRSVMAMKLGGEGVVPLIRPRADERVEPFALLMDEQKRRDLEEHWRLLYVGLTRARERLIIAGAMPKRAVADSWHALTARALTGMGAVAAAGGAAWGEALVWEGRGEHRAPRSRRTRTELSAPARPEWLDRPAPDEERPSRPLSPSALGTDQDSAPPPSPQLREAARRGVLLHSLFERLPGVEPSQRRELALRWLDRSGVSEARAREEIADSVCSVLGDAEYAELFSPAGLAEAPIAATLPDGRVIAGTVDRLLVGPDRVLVVDFKTGRSVPDDLAAVPQGHRLQMDAYAEALRVIFPEKRVEAALLYTHGPKLITLGG